MCSYLSDIDFSYLNSLDVELSWLAIKNTILGAIELFVPKMKSVVHNTQPVWFDNTIRHQIKCLRTMRRKVKQRFSLDKLKCLQEAEDKLQRSIVMARVNYENKLINDFSKQKNYTVYKYIRNTTKTRSIPELMYFNTQCGSCD